MSGICGLFHPDQRPVASADVATMTAMLEQRGPDGSSRWCDGAVGLGHTMLATTPGVLRESQPFRHPESSCVIVADVRLDYRDEVIGALGLEDRAAPGDAELILNAYLAWGEACLDRLLGDFAFAIWDPRNRTLFCARDRYGARPFYYHFAAEQQFVFASEPRAILALPQVPYALNEGRIADFIVEQLEWIDYESTFHQDVFRLPPAHKMTVSSSGIAISEYWNPAPGPALNCKTDSEYVEGFLEVFSNSVEERLQVPGSQVGSMLSGGMDSGSVTAITHVLLSGERELRLSAYSLARRRGVKCTESNRIYATLDFLGLSGTQIIADDIDSIADKLWTDFAEPFDGQFLFLRAIYETARRDGIEVVLDGAAGDLVFNEGAYIIRLLRRGRFRRAWREISGEQAFWGGSSALAVLFAQLGSAFAPQAIKTVLRKPKQDKREQGYVSASLISPEFAERIDFEERFNRMGQTFSDCWSGDPGLQRVRKIRPNLTAGRERYARIAASAGVEGRDPFADQRVIDYCSRLPDHMVARNGWPKYLLRVAMKDRLPDEVRWGRGKPHLGSLYNKTFLEREKIRDKLRLEDLAKSLEGYVDSASLRTAWRHFESGGNPNPVHSAYILSLWLAQSVTRPVVKNKRFG
jgi:asparagine synthase (glutamine-hydrolysing)